MNSKFDTSTLLVQHKSNKNVTLNGRDYTLRENSNGSYLAQAANKHGTSFYFSDITHVMQHCKLDN